MRISDSTARAASWPDTVELPAWILGDPQYRRRPMRTESRDLLTVIGCRGRRMPDGSLVGVYGGMQLADAAGCSDSGLWRRLRTLHRLGYVVTLTRGGSRQGVNLANVYGIPGRRGGLDRVRATTREIRMAPDGDGTWRPQVMHPGDEPTLWIGPNNRQAAPPAYPITDRPPPPVNGGKRGTNGECKNKNVKIHSGAQRSRSRPRIDAIKLIDLTDTGRLLGLYDQAVLRGWADPTEHDRIQFVAKACHVLRKYTSNSGPGPLFVSVLKAPLWDVVAACDEDTAISRLSEHLYNETPHKRSGGGCDYLE